jgi:hypothetical protein
MSQKPNLKNQNKLKVYLTKVKTNDTKSGGRTNNGDRKQTQAN